MANTTYTIKALDATTWEAFAALVDRNNGVFGGCWYVGFRSSGPDDEQRPAIRGGARRRRLRPFRARHSMTRRHGPCHRR
jgi:hypothetical protein